MKQARKKIGPDGSLRRFERLSNGLIRINVPEQPNESHFKEQESFFLIGRHLKKQGVSVPQIFSFSSKKGELLVEDLGDTLLFHVAKENKKGRLPLYKDAVRELVHFSLKGRYGFQESWVHRGVRYSSSFAWEKEIKYFLQFFVSQWAQMNVSHSLEEELQNFSHCVDRFDPVFLLHRDYQSRNLMVRDGKVYIIDFQDTMFGPLFYDLASLLWDPYTDLSEKEKEELLRIFLAELQGYDISFSEENAKDAYYTFSLIRLMQTLGAYSFLSQKRKKGFFAQFIPISFSRLFSLIEKHYFSSLPTLFVLLKQLRREKF